MDDILRSDQPNLQTAEPRLPLPVAIVAILGIFAAAMGALTILILGGAAMLGGRSGYVTIDRPDGVALMLLTLLAFCVIDVFLCVLLLRGRLWAFQVALLGSLGTAVSSVVAMAMLHRVLPLNAGAILTAVALWWTRDGYYRYAEGRHPGQRGLGKWWPAVLAVWIALAVGHVWAVRQIYGTPGDRTRGSIAHPGRAVDRAALMGELTVPRLIRPVNPNGGAERHSFPTVAR